MSKDVSIAVKGTIHKLQTFLLEGIKNEEQLFAAGTLMSCSDYEDVVIERSLAKMCGYPLCSNPLPSDAPQKGRYRISLKEHKVYDLNETHMYCSLSCVVNSRAFGKSLSAERCSVRNPSQLNDILRMFDNVSLESEDLGVKNDLSSNLKIQEKMGSSAGEVSLEEWIGASNAIEGYVPQRDRRPKTSLSKPRQEGSKSISSKQTSKSDSFFNDMDFSSVIITNDEYNITKDPSASTKTTSKLSLQEKKGTELRGLKSSSPGKHDSVKTSRKPKARKNKEVMKEELSGQDLSSPLSDAKAEESKVKEADNMSETKLKPSLKGSHTKNMSRSVTWADDKVGNSADRDLCEVRIMEDKEEDPDTITKTGTIILPYHDFDGENSTGNVNSDEKDAASVKWPLKTEMPEPDVFDHEDSSWVEGPPEGFSLMLSPFATMWMALFAWVTSSSLAYIYGSDESSHEDYLYVNGREYPRKAVLEDGRSSEIKRTVEGCLGRAIPGLVSELGLRTPNSSLEQAVGCLLETMSFVDAVPAFRMKQWQVFAFLFVEAISVCRIPALTSYMTTRRLVLHQVVDGARISAEEYELMKDLIMPLGRLPQAMSGA